VVVRIRKKKKIKSLSTKINADNKKIYKVSDPVELSRLFFPNNNAKHKRAAFLAIMYEIRNSSYKKARPTKLNKIPKKYEINKASYYKARAKMAKLGIISKASGYWKFIDGFRNAMSHLIKELDALKYPAETLLEEATEYANVQTAKEDELYLDEKKKNE
jgi:hypothetical protein